MFAPVPPPTFGPARPTLIVGEPPPGTTPHRTRVARRRHLLAQDAAEIAAALPGPGEATHLLMSGRYDLMQVIELAAGGGGPVAHLRLATLSLNRRVLADLLRLADAGAVARVSLVVSHYFASADKPLYHRLRAEFAARGFPVAAPRCHAKVVAVQFAAGDSLVMEGSANLRSNRNFEQLAVINDPRLHDWHARWIDLVINRHGDHDPPHPGD